MPVNTAALQHEGKGPIVVEEVPYTKPDADKILIKNKAWAVNPADLAFRDLLLAIEWDTLRYPMVLGCDAAGDVVEVGSSVTTFKVGDRVAGMCCGMGFNNNPECGFQTYTILQPAVAWRIPDNLTYAEAATLPLGLSTALVGLFAKEWLALDMPRLHAPIQNKTVLVWGAASSVGSNAVQLAVAAGYEVIATASTQNFNAVKALGAAQVFDYKAPDVVEQVVAALASKNYVGAECAAGSPEKCVQITSRVNGRKFVAGALPLPEDKEVKSVECKFIMAPLVKTEPYLNAVFRDFLPQVLENGAYKVVPPPLVVSKGVEGINAGLDAYKEGGFGIKKIVIEA